MQRLTSGQELTSQNFSCSLDDGEQLKAGVCPHAYVVFLAIAAVDGVNTRWHGAHLVAGDDARRCVLDYHQTAVKTRVGGQERRQASGPAQELDSPWKLPALMTSPLSGNRMGLSVTAVASPSRVSMPRSMALRTAP